MTTTAIETRQAYCRGCAAPTFEYEVGQTFTPDRLYCDNCYGTRRPYGSEPYCESCDSYECEHAEEMDADNAYYGNTNEHDPILDYGEWTRLVNLRHKRTVNHDTALPPLVSPSPPPPTEDDDEEYQTLADQHTCYCGSTRFILRAEVPTEITYAAVDISDLPPDETVYAETSIECTGGPTGDEYNERFSCSFCGRAYTGDWER